MKTWENTRMEEKYRTALLIVVTIVVLFTVACREGHAAEQLDWLPVTESVRRELQQRDLIEWSNELARRLDEANTATLITALDVFIRAGQPKRISCAIQKLGAQQLGSLHDGGWCAERLLRLGYYTQAREWFDSVGQSFCGMDLMRAFVLNWEVTGKPDKLERWLEEKAGGEDRSSFGRNGQWAHLYYWYLARRKKLQSHLDGLAKEVRRDPTQRDPMFRYLAARRHLAGVLPSLDWLGRIAKPVHALDAFELAQIMQDDQIESAIRLLDRSLTLPVTDYDRKWFNKRRMCAAYIPPDAVETTLRKWTKARLAAACFAAKKLDRAQKLVEELTGKKGGALDDLGPLRFAGQVQAATGQRVVEGRIKEAEGSRKNSERYWLARAQYYIGRKETAEAEKAYKSALALKPGRERFSVVRDYGWFMSGMGRRRDAETLFRSELERVGVGGSDSEFWIQQLKNLDGEGGVTFAWNDPIMWQWLALKRKTYFGQQAQWNLRWCWRKAADERPKFWVKAKALAGEKPSAPLDYIFGTLLASEGKKIEALKRMASAWDRWTTPAYPEHRQVGLELMGLYVGQGNRQEAEKVLLSLRNVAGFSESAEKDWLARLATSAAQAGNKDDAMRLWQERVRHGLTDHRGLRELASHGLRKRLSAYYTELAKRAPGNDTIAIALKELAK